MSAVQRATRATSSGAAVGTRVKQGPFQWERVSRESGEEVWLLVGLPEFTTMFVLKNYGGTPGPGFAGWKLVSGGPFDEPGAWSTFEEASVGAAPWLTVYFCKQAEEAMDQAVAMAKAAEELLRRLQ